MATDLEKSSREPDRSTTQTGSGLSGSSDAGLLDALARQVSDRQATAPQPNPLRVKPELRVTVSDDAESWTERQQRRRHEELREARRGATRGSLARMGSRYAECSFANFRCERPEQQAVVERLERYDWLHRPNVLLFGPKGTGKDHLLTALVRRAGEGDLGVLWRNGLDLFGEWRDAVGSEERERDAIAPLVGCDVLALSDPLPPSGALSEWQQQMLARVIDGRYRRMAPTWATLNVVSGEEADARLGPLIADRLRDGAVALFCNWPSYRRTAT